MRNCFHILLFIQHPLFIIVIFYLDSWVAPLRKSHALLLSLKNKRGGQGVWICMGGTGGTRAMPCCCRCKNKRGGQDVRICMGGTGGRWHPTRILLLPLGARMYGYVWAAQAAGGSRSRWLTPNKEEWSRPGGHERLGRPKAAPVLPHHHHGLNDSHRWPAPPHTPALATGRGGAHTTHGKIRGYLEQGGSHTHKKTKQKTQRVRHTLRIGGTGQWLLSLKVVAAEGLVRSTGRDRAVRWFTRGCTPHWAVQP